MSQVASSRVKITGDNLDGLAWVYQNILARVNSRSILPYHREATLAPLHLRIQGNIEPDVPSLGKMINCRQPSSQMVRLLIRRGNRDPKTNILCRSSHGGDHSQRFINGPLST